jgi:hypothetical protein
MEVLTIAGTGGGTTLTTTNYFTKVTQIAIQAQADTGGAFQFGQSDALLNCKYLHAGGTGNAQVVYLDGSTDTVLGLANGELIPGPIRELIATSTTITNFTAYK